MSWPVLVGIVANVIVWFLVWQAWRRRRMERRAWAVYKKMHTPEDAE